MVRGKSSLIVYHKTLSLVSQIGVQSQAVEITRPAAAGESHRPWVKVMEQRFLDKVGEKGRNPAVDQRVERTIVLTPRFHTIGIVLRPASGGKR